MKEDTNFFTITSIYPSVLAIVYEMMDLSIKFKYRKTDAFNFICIYFYINFIVTFFLVLSLSISIINNSKLLGLPLKIDHRLRRFYYLYL